MTSFQPDLTPSRRLLLNLAGYLGPPAIVAWGATLRVKLPDGLPPPFVHPELGPAIYVCWHQCLLPMTWYCRGRGIGTLISQHADGEAIARAVSRMGYRPIRGSSTRGGAGAMQEMTAAVLAGSSMAITLDGPRGPCCVAKPGALYLSHATQAPVYAIHVRMPRAWTLNSWDHFQLPHPGSAITAVWKGPYRVPAEAGKPEIEILRQRLENDLNQLRLAPLPDAPRS